MGLSRREYARRRGVSEAAVRKAIASGRIRPEPDGRIDPERADADWAAQTDPAKQRGPHATAMGIEATARWRAEAAAAAGMKPVPQAAIAAVDETLRDAGEEPAPGEAGGEAGSGEVSFLRARLANEVLKAQTAKVRLRKMKGELVDRNRATAAVFDAARRERDAWLAWPARVAANMAAELGVDAHALERALLTYLRVQLAEMAEVKLELR